MSSHHRSTGIVFQKRDVGEADRFYSVFTKEFGRLELLARSVRQPAAKLRAQLEPFVLSEVEFVQGKSAKTVTNVQQVAAFPRLRQHFVASMACFEISNLFDKLVQREEADPAIFELLESALCRIDEKADDDDAVHLIVTAFGWKLVAGLGYAPELRVCAHCGKKMSSGMMYLVPEGYGLMCKACAARHTAAIHLSHDAVKVIRLMAEDTFQNLLRVRGASQHTKTARRAVAEYIRIVLTEST